MKARLEFGLKDEQGQLCYSSDHELDFRFDDIPPLELDIRFDVPCFDDDGRWVKNSDGTYYIDGGDPIHAIVKSVEAHVCDQTQSKITFLRVKTVVKDNGVQPAKEKVEKLIEFSGYLSNLKRAKKVRVSDAQSGFSREQSYFLQGKMCETIANVANLTLGSFHENDTLMAKTIEHIIKEKWGLKFCLGPD